MAEHMAQAWRTIPHATAFDEFDATALVALRQTLQPVAEQRNTHLTYLPILLKLLIPALQKFPLLNASLDEEAREIILKNSYHLGIATATPRGLLVPVVRNADELSIVQMALEIARLHQEAQQGTLTPRELSGSTFTVSNVGSYGGSSGTPIINAPEAALLAVGRVEEKAIARHGTLIAQQRMPIALAFDHRLIDGAMAGAFLAHYKELVEQPQQLLLDLI
jgi:pyruvate dehydrogenase E2 component (dihydrolipoamide acetyltransferase)